MASATNQPGGIWIGIAQDELFFGWKRWLSFACIWVWSCLSMRFSIASGVFSHLPQLLSIPNEVVLLSTACAVPASVFFNYNTIDALSAYLWQMYSGEDRAAAAVPDGDPASLSETALQRLLEKELEGLK